MKILKLLGYRNDLNSQDKFSYIIAGCCLAVVLSFLLFYIIFIRSFWVNLSTLFCTILVLCALFLLKRRKMRAAKALMNGTFLLQVALLVFFWFPPEAGMSYFFFIVAPVTFLIYDIENDKEKRTTILFNFLATGLLLLSAVMPNRNPVVTLTPAAEMILSVMSILSTIGAMSVVFYFYAQALKERHRELNLLAQTDSLTKTYNRRTLFKEGEDLFLSCKRQDRQFLFLIFDIDHFKRVNDNYGHPVGDKVLIELSRLVSSKIRQNDLFSRYGGEEFAIILKNVSSESEEKVVENIRKIVEAHRFAPAEGLSLPITISVGAVRFSHRFSSFEDMVGSADAALYLAKEQGRNRVVWGS